MKEIYELKKRLDMFGLSRFYKPSKPHAWADVITVRSEPKANRRREKKARNSLLRLWKRQYGIKGRLSEQVFRNFLKSYKSIFK
jgi:hypothetical protein